MLLPWFFCPSQSSVRASWLVARDFGLSSRVTSDLQDLTFSGTVLYKWYASGTKPRSIILETEAHLGKVRLGWSVEECLNPWGCIFPPLAGQVFWTARLGIARAHRFFHFVWRCPTMCLGAV
mmetsp:Transcript_31213/g.83060  ORF Transcript_31213/g.83060 Transcript_31213/m.83060 type:complete len:122 (+) Transcript_31213:1121-1486(+)